jgi:NADH dehydrogenase FAD-containing subunit
MHDLFKKDEIVDPRVGTPYPPTAQIALRQARVAANNIISVINSIRQQRMLKMMAIAHSVHFSYQNGDDLVDFIASEMRKEGFDANNEENLDSYLNTEFM